MVDNLEEEHMRREVFTTAIETSSQDVAKHMVGGISGSKDPSYDLGTNNLSAMNQASADNQGMGSPLGS